MKTEGGGGIGSPFEMNFRSIPMKAVIQRVLSARVEVDGQIVGEIARGLVVFVGVGGDDTEANAVKLAAKIAALRIFSDDEGRFNYSVRDVSGAVLLISNFTLCGDARKGNRPSFTSAAAPNVAERLYQRLATLLREKEVPVQTGSFGADMRVFVENDGPVTMMLDF